MEIEGGLLAIDGSIEMSLSAIDRSMAENVTVEKEQMYVKNGCPGILNGGG